MIPSCSMRCIINICSSCQCVTSNVSKQTKTSLILACGGGGGKGADAIGYADISASTGGGGGGNGGAGGSGTDDAAGSGPLSCKWFIQLLSKWICWMKNLLTATWYKTYIKTSWPCSGHHLRQPAWEMTSMKPLHAGNFNLEASYKDYI